MVHKFLLREVYADHFRSLLDFSLRLNTGLIVIQGNNGSGKSSAVMAIQYALFGRAGKHTKNDLSSWLTGEVPSVKVGLIKGDDSLVVSRGKSLSFSINGKREKVREHPVFRDLVDGLKYSFLTPDFISFIDLKPAERREVLVELIPDLSLIRKEVLPYVNELSTRTANTRQRTENRLFSINGEIKGIEEDIKTLEVNYKNAVEAIEELSKKLASLEEQKQAIEKELSKIDNEYVDFLKEKEQQLRNEKELLSSERSELYKRLNEMSRLVGLVKGLQDKLVSLQQTIADANSSIKEMRCKWCGSKIGIEQATRIEEKSKTVEKEADKIKNQISAYMEKLKDKKKLEEQLKEIDGKIEEVDLALEKVRYDLACIYDIQSRLESVKDTYEKTKSAYERIKTSLDASSSISEMRRKLRKLRAEKKRVEKKLNVFNNLEGMFSNITSFLRRDIVDIYVKNVCTVLEGAANELLSGEGFEVEIMPDGGRVQFLINGAKFYQFSAGERQRIRIGTTLAFAALANRSGFVVVDELFDSNLDEEGIIFLAECISGWLRRRFEQVILITQRQDLMALLNPDQIVRLEKDGGKTEITSAT